MFSDTHFHFNILDQEAYPLKEEILLGMLNNDCHFGLDIGVKYDDLFSRQRLVDLAIYKLEPELREKVRKFIYFSAGIWPSVEAIKNRREELSILEKNIHEALDSKNELCKKLVALGECGIDHHWNPSGVDGRNESDFNDEIYNGEKELFVEQLKMAEKFRLPVIVHSRDGFAETIECLDKAGYHKGIIHCYSYGLEEAKQFLERGWYLAFGGGVTYTKKAKMDQMVELLRYVPSDRLLLETDAPYLSPVPLRGTPNTPLNIEHVYKFIADIRGVSVLELCDLVDKNIDELFGIK